MAEGCGKLYFCRLSYKPEPGERKSGIPAARRKIKILNNLYFNVVDIEILTSRDTSSYHGYNIFKTFGLPMICQALKC